MISPVSSIPLPARHRRPLLANGLAIAIFLLTADARAQSPHQQDPQSIASDRATAVPVSGDVGPAADSASEATRAFAENKALRDRITELEARVGQLTDALTSAAKKAQDTAGVSDIDQLLAQRQALIDRANGLDAHVAQLTAALTEIVKKIQDAGFSNIDQLLAQRAELIRRDKPAALAPEPQPAVPPPAATNTVTPPKPASSGSSIPFFVIGIMLGVGVTALFKWSVIAGVKDPVLAMLLRDQRRLRARQRHVARVLRHIADATDAWRDTLERGRSELDQLVGSSQSLVAELESTTESIQHRLARLDANPQQT